MRMEMLKDMMFQHHKVNFDLIMKIE